MKKFLFCLLIMSLLILVPSCNKKDSGDTDTVQAPESGSIVTGRMTESTPEDTQKSVVKEAEAIIKTTETVEDKKESPVEEKVEVKVEEIPVITVEEKKEPLELTTLSSEEKGPDYELNEFYRGGELLVKAAIKPESASIKFNITDDEILKIISRVVVEYPDSKNGVEYTLSDGLVELKYSYINESSAEEYWTLFKNFLNSYNVEKDSLLSVEDDELVITKENDTVKGTIKANIYQDKVELYIPSELEGDYEAVVLSLLEEYPYITESLSFVSKDGEKIVLTYLGEFGNREASLYFDELVDYINAYFKEDVAVEEKKTEEKAPVTETVTEKKEEKASLPKVDFNRFALSLGFNNAYDTKDKYAPVFSGEFDYYILKDFALGLKAGYDFTGYMHLSLALRWYTPFVDGLYLSGDAGAKIGIGQNKSAGLLLGGALGYEIKINESFKAFAEADVMYMTKRQKSVRFGLTIGGRYCF